MLRYKEDIRVLVWMVITTGLLVINWLQPEPNILLIIWACFMSGTVATIVHNHLHLGVWKHKWLNVLQDYWLCAFYGFPVFAWIPTHNKNHHKLNNKEGDYTITYRISEKNNIFTLLTYPSISGFFQQKPTRDYLAKMWKVKRSRFWYFISQYVFIAAFIGVALWLDWQKALMYVVLPQQFSLFMALFFNYLQHVHTDELSEWNHSRNFVSPVFNALTFNVGYHTIHHDHPGIHWSRLAEEHAKISDNIDPSLNVRSFWWLMLSSYVLGPFIPNLRTKSMRVARMEREATRSMGDAELAAAE